MSFAVKRASARRLSHGLLEYGKSYVDLRIAYGQRRTKADGILTASEDEKASFIGASDDAIAPIGARGFQVRQSDEERVFISSFGASVPAIDSDFRPNQSRSLNSRCRDYVSRLTMQTG